MFSTLLYSDHQRTSEGILLVKPHMFQDTVSLALSGLKSDSGYRLLEANCEVPHRYAFPIWPTLSFQGNWRGGHLSVLAIFNVMPISGYKASSTRQLDAADRPSGGVRSTSRRGARPGRRGGGGDALHGQDGPLQAHDGVR
eukprot:1640353-Pyramimonas_sp.AAC.1